MRLAALAAAASLSFCLPPQEGKVVFVTFSDTGYVMQVPYRHYLTDAQNVESWQRAVSGPVVRVRVAPASEGLTRC